MAFEPDRANRESFRGHKWDTLPKPMGLTHLNYYLSLMLINTLVSDIIKHWSYLVIAIIGIALGVAFGIFGAKKIKIPRITLPIFKQQVRKIVAVGDILIIGFISAIILLEHTYRHDELSELVLYAGEFNAALLTWYQLVARKLKSGPTP